MQTPLDVPMGSMDPGVRVPGSRERDGALCERREGVGSPLTGVWVPENTVEAGRTLGVGVKDEES